MTCCGKGMHQTCFAKKMKSKSMSLEQKNSCCLCRTKLVTIPGSKEDLERIRHFVQKGKGWSMAMLAQKYEKGEGVTQSWKQAAHFYKMAVEHGDIGSMVHLGVLYMTGNGVDQNVEKGKELFLKAAALGDIPAIMNLKKMDKIEGNTTPSFTPIPTFCTYCGKAHNPPTTKLNFCRGCRCAYYCCKEHQRLDWRMKLNGHKEKCQAIQKI